MRNLIVMLSILASSNAMAIDLDAKAAEKYALYAMMASNSYLKKDRTYFPIEELGWVRVDLGGNPTSENSYSYSGPLRQDNNASSLRG